MATSSMLLNNIVQAPIITDLTEDTTPDYSLDKLAMYDASQSYERKLCFCNSGVWVQLATATASSSATINFNNLDNRFSHYTIIVQNLTVATDNANLNFRTSSNNGISYASTVGDYTHSVYYHTESAVASSTFSLGSCVLTYNGLGNDAGNLCFGVINIFNPSGSYRCKMGSEFIYMSSAETVNRAMSSFYRNDASYVNAVRIYASSGSIASGTFTLYGIK